MIGDFQWSDEEWIRIFENFIKMGLTEKIGISFLLLCQDFAKMKSFDILFKIQEKIVPNLFKLLKIEPYRNYAIKIITFFTLDSPLNTSWMGKLIHKFLLGIKELSKIDANHMKEFIDLLFAIKRKYSNSSIADDLETSTMQIIEDIKYNPEEINPERFNLSLWGENNIMLNQSSENKIKYRGLQNIGNSKILD